MSVTLTLASAHDVADLQTFLQRAERLGCSLTRLTTSGPFLAAIVCVLEKQGLLDTHPNVLGMRVVELAPVGQPDSPNVDALVETRALLDRLAHRSTRDNHVIDMPVTQPRVPWAGISPPHSGWQLAGHVSSATFASTARSGIDEVAAANGLGTHIVTEVRRTVWSRPLAVQPATSPEPEHSSTLVSGMAFAAFGLGFVVEGDDDEVRVTTQGAWTRASTRRGDVLARV